MKTAFEWIGLKFGIDILESQRMNSDDFEDPLIAGSFCFVMENKSSELDQA